eukprot:TRINITY_DN49250_c0_g1_i1.p1 TRINITY_DN49250_c0_g1~~TRINITY_DN49250_c0_g1_i1.p1  ORF type:complete len:176 (+),score=17.39 TRINITY_DN49250_c0_g1_i1:83-610(+)
MRDVAIDLPLGLVFVFFAILIYVVSASPRMFLRRHGRYHRIIGLFFLGWLLIGFLDIKANFINRLLYDVLLSLFGTLLAVSAAFEFGHKNVTNQASGVLDEDATVTYSEMIEHSCYQMLNLVQICFLHSFGLDMSPTKRAMLLLCATCPWCLRSYFPVNSFSANYCESCKHDLDW